MSSKTSPTTDLERSLAAQGSRFLIGIDEVGRGAIAGPVAVGVALIDTRANSLDEFPQGLRDSKLLTEKQRESLIGPISQWLAGSAVGMVVASEIDEFGIIAALSKSASRGLSELLSDSQLRTAIARDGATIILDGSHNWLGAEAGGLSVVAREKADRDCAIVSAAAVVAKVERDHLMVRLGAEHPGYLLEGHKGYASSAHIEAVRALGPSPVHRVTWLTKILAGSNVDLPTVDSSDI
ncbi:MAG: ribonuclease HII [Microbacteriaceae bacterium]|nr:ribonuclease HII [Microbacteriaceae bacterium]